MGAHYSRIYETARAELKDQTKEPRTRGIESSDG